MTICTKLFTAALLASGAMMTAPASAAPLSAPMGLTNSVASPVEAVQWRRGYRGGWRGGYRRGWGPGIGIGAGLAAGAIIGGALAAPYYYGPRYVEPGYAYSPGYVEVEPAVPAGDATAYCMQRFQSYDPASGTYLGYDGVRHPCP
jgi:hypothetical protein